MQLEGRNGARSMQPAMFRPILNISKLVPDSVWALRGNRRRCKSGATPSWDVGSRSEKFLRHKDDPELNVLAPG